MKFFRAQENKSELATSDGASFGCSPAADVVMFPSPSKKAAGVFSSMAIASSNGKNVIPADASVMRYYGSVGASCFCSPTDIVALKFASAAYSRRCASALLYRSASRNQRTRRSVRPAMQRIVRSRCAANPVPGLSLSWAPDQQRTTPQAGAPRCTRGTKTSSWDDLSLSLPPH